MMYSHYLYTSFGYTNPFKKLITQAQLIQFATCIVRKNPKVTKSALYLLLF